MPDAMFVRCRSEIVYVLPERRPLRPADRYRVWRCPILLYITKAMFCQADRVRRSVMTGRVSVGVTAGQPTRVVVMTAGHGMGSGA